MHSNSLCINLLRNMWRMIFKKGSDYWDSNEKGATLRIYVSFSQSKERVFTRNLEISFTFNMINLTLSSYKIPFDK